jgi:penicillin-binding protein 2
MQMGVMDEKTIFPCGGGFFIKGKELKVMVEQIRLFLLFRFPVTVSLPMHLLRSLKNIRKSFKGVDEWKKIMSSFGVGEFLNNDFAVGAKGRIPSGDFMKKGLKPL